MTIVAEIALDHSSCCGWCERRFALRAATLWKLIAPSRVFSFSDHTAALEE